MKLRHYLMLVLIISVLKLKHAQQINEFNHITIFDVGQGDTILLSLGEAHYLIDGGPDYEVSRYLREYFKSKTCVLSGVFLTHPHSDHLEGIRRLVDYCDIKHIFIHKLIYESYAFKDFLTVINTKEARKEIEVSSLYTGDTIVLSDDVKLHVFWPGTAFMKNYNISDAVTRKNNLNNASLLLLLDMDTYEALFTGDLEKDVFWKLDADRLVSKVDLPLELLKVGHHGAANAYDQKLLRLLRPRSCVISVGKNNKYGHPSSVVVDGLKKLGCNIYQTSEHGNLQFLLP